MTEVIPIYWQFPEGDIKRFLNADSHDIFDDDPMFDTTDRKEVRITAEAVVLEDVPPVGASRGSKYRKGEVIKVFTGGGFGTPIWNVVPDYDDLNVHWNITFTKVEGGNLSAGYCSRETSRWTPQTRKPNVYSGTVIKRPGNYVQPSIVQTDYEGAGRIGFRNWNFEVLPDRETKQCLDGIPRRCTISFYKDGQLVHSETQRECPEVWTEEERCPEGTCPVECGDRICCYDGNGIAVTSISN